MKKMMIEEGRGRIEEKRINIERKRERGRREKRIEQRNQTRWTRDGHGWGGETRAGID